MSTGVTFSSKSSPEDDDCEGKEKEGVSERVEIGRVERPPVFAFPLLENELESWWNGRTVLSDRSVNDEHGSHSSSGVVEDPER